MMRTGLAAALGSALLAVLLSGCSLFFSRRPMPTAERFVEIEQAVEDHLRRAEEIGVGDRSQESGVIGVGALDYMFSAFTSLARDFPEDRGPAGSFITEVLVPALLRARDAIERDRGQIDARAVERHIGPCFKNTMAMERWSQEIERRVLLGQAGFTNLYWSRVVPCRLEEVPLATARYQALLERCHAQEGGCDAEVARRIESTLHSLGTWPEDCAG